MSEIAPLPQEVLQLREAGPIHGYIFMYIEDIM